MPSRAPRRKNFWGNSRGKANIEVARYLLSARQVQTAGAGDLCDGGGLLLRVQANSAAWVFRFTSPTGKRRELGLGAAVRNSITDAGKSLTDARDAADAARKLLRDGRDPIDVRIGRDGRSVRGCRAPCIVQHPHLALATLLEGIEAPRPSLS
jgi:hypothetical protein